MIKMATTPILDEEFGAFCKKDGLSPSGTHLQLWKEARPLGLLVAIWAVHHGEMPEGQQLFDIQALEPYAVSPLEPVYLTPSETAIRLKVSNSRVRHILDDGDLPFKATPLGRLIDERDLEKYMATRQTRRRPFNSEA